MSASAPNVEAGNSEGFQAHTVVSGGVRLRCMASGSVSGPMVLFLHGFPARWATWRQQMRALAAEGFLAVAPDLRGYGESDKPAGVKAYAAPRFVDDVAAIVRGFGKEKTFLVGHDFGGGFAWMVAMQRPDLVTRLAALNTVHPAGFDRRIRKWSQLKKSHYIFFFQLPWIPEWVLSRDDFALVRQALARDGLAPPVIDDLVAGIAPRGSLHAALNYYRALLRAPRALAYRKVEVPVLVVWGDREPYLDAELADPPADWATHVRVEHLPAAAHWVHHDDPERVSALLLEHFGA